MSSCLPHLHPAWEQPSQLPVSSQGTCEWEPPQLIARVRILFLGCKLVFIVFNVEVRGSHYLQGCDVVLPDNNPPVS